MATSNRELKMRCLELATELTSPNKSPEVVIECADKLYESLPTETKEKSASKKKAGEA